jgi:3-hydroxyisobutyrate dehydrogenase-like beta-hydroxyacid dehydrogenase
MKRVGLIGLGNMGSYYAKKLLDAGYPLTVFDIDPQKLEKAVKQGAVLADTPTKVTQIRTLLFCRYPIVKSSSRLWKASTAY